MSLTISTDRASLLAEARKEWLSEQQSKALTTGKAASTNTPSDTQLIATDAVLKAELAKLTDATDKLTTISVMA